MVDEEFGEGGLGEEGVGGLCAVDGDGGCLRGVLFELDAGYGEDEGGLEGSSSIVRWVHWDTPIHGQWFFQLAPKAFVG